MTRAAIFGCEGLALSPAEAAFFRDADPWGFILFARNLESVEQIRALTGELRNAVGRDAPVLIDQEGGRVARLLPPVWTGWDNALPFMGAIAPAHRAEAMRLRYGVIGAELAALGIDVNCAPMADVARADTHPLIRHRCYSSDPEEVGHLGRAVAEGLMGCGVLPVLKHIPGHGATPLDSHEDLPRVELSRATLDAVDFAPFQALADLPLGMTAHIVYPDIDPAACATLSAPVIEVIRKGIGFDGLLMTDDISMGALSGPMEGRCQMALQVGCDLILHCNADMDEMRAVAAATPALAPQAVIRDRRAQALRAPAPSFDIPAALERLAILTAESAHA